MSEIGLLLATPSGQPCLPEGLDAAAAAVAPAPDGEDVTLLNRGRDWNDLHHQRYAVLLRDGDQHLLSALDPLLKRRAREQGSDIERWVIPAGEDADGWLQKNYYSLRAIKRPRYVLLLGDFDKISLRAQQRLQLQALAGRLCLPDVDAYRCYADKVCAAADRAERPGRRRAQFACVNDGTEAAAAGCAELVGPCLRESERWHKRPDESELHMEPPLRLQSPTTHGADAAVLLSVSHGVGAPDNGWSSAQEQQQLQGALSLGTNSVFDAQKAAGGTFLPSGIWIYVACFGAGTPAQSAFEPWLRGLPDELRPTGLQTVWRGLSLSGHPFVAALPQRLLANEQGPLAVISHLDLTWTYSFWTDQNPTVSRNYHFGEVIRYLLQGDRLGVAVDAFNQGYHQVNDWLTTENNQEPKRRGYLWLLHHDLRGFITLGDPAVRLPPAQHP